MKLSVNPFLLIRIPVFPLEAQLTEVWENLKQYIGQSSPSFYENIRHIKSEELHKTDTKIQYTIWKYFNRSKYRGTPYGSFAGFATSTLGDDKQPIQIRNKQKMHVFKDWKPITAKANYPDELLFNPARLYLANTSVYIVHKSIRFLCLQDKTFELVEIKRSEFLETLLQKCKRQTTLKQLQIFAAAKGVKVNVLKGILRSLMELQLLFTDLNPNIIGPDYYNRGEKVLYLPDQTYLIAEREIESGNLHKSLLQALPECIEYLCAIQPQLESINLNRFKAAFLERYGHQQVPLMEVLDPELGLGYGSLESTASNDDLINELMGSDTVSSEIQFYPQQNKIVKHLLNAIIATKGDRKQVIQLQHISVPLSSRQRSTANSFNLLLRFADDLIILDMAGGSTANALLGRFTLASKAIEEQCKKIARFETMANPDVIFFDVAYAAEGRVDNINRRKSVYRHELPLLNYSCSRNLLHLEDLLITVENNEAILISKKYGKRIVPRLASAYNYTRSDLSVYRLLCDLQGQQIQNQMIFDLQLLIPGLNFYPRFQYGNVVLSPAKWKINAADIKGSSLNIHLDFMQVSRYFTAGIADQTLCFDRNSETDLLNFGRYLEQHKDFIITEAFIAEQPIVKDKDHNAYFSQFMLTLQHSNQLYQPCFPSNAVIKEADTIIVPGKDWLSFEIYCHPNSANRILSHEVLKFIERYEREFKCWFFLRYNKPSHHIRLRFQLKEPKDGYFFISALTNAFESYLRAGFIFDIQLKTYKRELSRYRHVEITHIEQLFCTDSKYCLNSFIHEPTSFEMYSVCIRMMYMLIRKLDPGHNSGLNFIKRVQDSLMKEHGFKNNDFKKINQAYLKFAYDTKISLNDELLMISCDSLLQSFAKVLECCATEGKMNLLADLFHMHINRRFPDNQRIHEMIIYSFLYKILQREHKKQHSFS